MPTHRMKEDALIVALLAFTLSTAGPSVFAETGATNAKDPLFTGAFSFYVENDSLPLAGGDESYTQGLELHLSLEKGKLPKPLALLRKATRGPLLCLQGGRDYPQSGSSFLFGQTIFTPQNIITYEPRRDDRPFVGHLYAGVSSVLAANWAHEDGKTLHPRRLTAQLILGVTGDAAGAHTSQAAFHVLRESRIPKGWYTQAGNRPELNAIFIQEDIVSPEGLSEYADLTTVEQAALGTTQAFASAGAVLRIGYGLSGFPPLNIPQAAAPSKPPKPFELAALVGVEAKALAWSRLADQGGAGRPNLKPFVYEWRVGAMARLSNGLSVSYVVRRRSQEIEPLPEGVRARHWIGALQISKSPTTDHDFLDFLKGVRVNFGLGRGRSTTEPGLPADPRLSLAGHWGLEGSLFKNRIALAVETTGVVREHGRGDGTSHQDTFLLAKVATLGVELLPELGGRQRLQLRVGGGIGTVKTQTMPVEGTIDEPELHNVSENGSSGLVGVRYTVKLGKGVSLALNGTYSRLFLDGSDTGVRRAGYWTSTAGVQLHPWGRDREATKH